MRLTLYGLLDCPLGEKAGPLRMKYIQQEEEGEMQVWTQASRARAAGCVEGHTRSSGFEKMKNQIQRRIIG